MTILWGQDAPAEWHECPCYIVTTYLRGSRTGQIVLAGRPVISRPDSKVWPLTSYPQPIPQRVPHRAHRRQRHFKPPSAGKGQVRQAGKSIEPFGVAA